MRSQCVLNVLFCLANLGVNRTLEQFPVGRRVAFDSIKGRLWAVCPNCGRWNLAPLDERWETLVECERLFKRANVAHSWGDISLGRLSNRLELIRVGKALPNELPAWRYPAVGGRNERLRKYWNKVNRRRRLISYGKIASASAGGTALALGAAFITPAAWAAILPTVGLGLLSIRRKARRTVAHVQSADGQPLALTVTDIRSALLSSKGSQLAMQLPRLNVTLIGRECVWALALWIPRLSRIGSERFLLGAAAYYIEHFGGPDGALERIAQTELGEEEWCLGKLPDLVRLVLEMAATGDVEGAATIEELERLKRAWREAEEIAAVADKLLIPTKLDEWLAKHRPVGRESSER